MKAVRWLNVFALCTVLISIYIIISPLAHASGSDVVLPNWQVQWIGEDSLSDSSPDANGPWLDADTDHPLTHVPTGMHGMWVRFQVPSTMKWQQPGMLVERLYGHQLSVYQGNTLLFTSKRDFVFDLNKLLLPVDKFTGDTEFYIRIVTLSERSGLISGIRIGDFEDLTNRFVRKDLPDLLLGASITFVGLIMLVCSGYLNRKQRRTWISLCLITLTTGTLIVLNSPLPYIYYKQYGDFFLAMLDVSLFVLFPALSFYVDRVLEEKFIFFSRFRKVQFGYSIFCFLLLAANWATNERFFHIYYVFTVLILGLLIMAQLLQITVLSIINAVKGNRNALILSIGIAGLALSGVADLTFFYLNGTSYELVLWKFGVVFMILTLVIILARRISADHAMLITYSKELELHNHKMQRTEKLKMISDLAASVAHEVRNPLQVTRGFVQLLAERTDERNKIYLGMAISELDRASEIITDFLTFAKPELEEAKVLDLAVEMRQIEVMMTPLITMQGGELRLKVQEGLAIYGNSSKFKQAFINIIKNSIEAISRDGLININAYSEKDLTIIHITDNGEGMEEDEVSKLGEPYFSTKTKGTGLGLMVTFRIIEVMQGTIEFSSSKGKGTEVTIRFPIINQAILPGGVRA